MMQDREFTNLTKAQVEALLECFDYFANGWIEYQFIRLSDVWIVGLKHRRTQKDMKIFIHPNRYRVRVNFVTRKKREFEPDGSRYRLWVNSDASVGVVRLSARASLM